MDYSHLCVLQLANFVAAIVSPPPGVSGMHTREQQQQRKVCLGSFYFSHLSENSNISLKMLSRKTEAGPTEGGVRTQYGWEGPLKQRPLSLQHCQKIAPGGLKIKWKTQEIRKTGSPKLEVSASSSHGYPPTFFLFKVLLNLETQLPVKDAESLNHKRYVKHSIRLQTSFF